MALTAGPATEEFIRAAGGAVGRLLALAEEQTFKKLLSMAEAHKAEMAAASEQARAAAAAAYLTSGAKFQSYLAQIIANNPEKTFQQIMGRADVQSAMHNSLDWAYNNARESIMTGFANGSTLGLAHAGAELAVLGLEGPTEQIPASGLLNAALDRLAVMNDEAANRLTVGAQTGFGAALLPGSYHEAGDGVVNVGAELAKRRASGAEGELAKVYRDLSLRAGAGATVATVKGHSEAKIDAFATTGAANGIVIRKVWTANFEAGNVCPVCASLHGTVLSLEVQFPQHATFAAGPTPEVFHDLAGPPRHPHCKCQVLPFIEGIADGPGPSPVAMQAAALKYAQAQKGMAPRTFPLDDVSALARTTAHLTAADVRTMPQTRFDAALDAFRACVLSKEQRRNRG